MVQGAEEDGERGTTRGGCGRGLSFVTSDSAQRRNALRNSTFLVNSTGGSGAGRPTRWSIVKTSRWDRRISLREQDWQVSRTAIIGTAGF